MRTRRRNNEGIVVVLLGVLGLFVLFGATSLADHGRHGPPAFIGEYGFPPGKPPDRPPEDPSEDPPGKPPDRPPPHSGGPPHGGNPPGHQDPKGGGTPPGQSGSFNQASIPIVNYPINAPIALAALLLVGGLTVRLATGARGTLGGGRQGR